MTLRNKALAIGALLVVSIFYWSVRQDKVEEPTVVARVAEDARSDDRLARSPIATTNVGAVITDVDQNEIERLRERFGAKIGHPYGQIKLVEALLRHYRKTSGAQWRQDLLRAVRAAFPEHYDEIVKKLDAWLEYEQWMKDNRAKLDGMEPEARRAAIQAERERLFGQEATETIWASEHKNQAMADTLKEIDALEGSNVREKLATYTKRLEEIHEETYEKYLEQHRHETMNRFLSLDSVQADLSAMSASERKEALRDIRKGMGLDDAALQRWDTLDQQRDSRWDDGTKYMAERSALLKAHSGTELKDKLDALRAKYFGSEADVIASEEDSGFLRFGGPRKWGQN